MEVALTSSDLFYKPMLRGVVYSRIFRQFCVRFCNVYVFFEWNAIISLLPRIIFQTNNDGVAELNDSYNAGNGMMASIYG